MKESTPTDARIEQVKQRLADELVGGDGQPGSPDTVNLAVDASAERLADAPVQDFVPLLVEHEARDALSELGLHREFDDEPSEGHGDAAESFPHDDQVGGHSTDSSSPFALPD